MATCLDQNEVDTAATPGKLSDGEGLYLDVRSATSASWLFRFTYGQKPDEVGLGSRKKVSLKRARELREWCVRELANGHNPKASLRTQKLELIRAVNAPKGKTVYETARDHVSLIAKNLNVEKGRDAWVRSMHADFIGYIADMDPAAVTEDDVLPLLKRLYADTPVLADDIRQRLTRVLGWACRRVPGWSNPVKWEDNLEHDLKRREAGEEKHHAALPAFRVGKFVNTLRTREENALALRLALEWHIISATRPGEAAGADFREFDWANDCWVIPAARMKMRRPHRVPLTARHHEILDLILGGAEPPMSGPVFSVRTGKAVSVTGLRRVMHGVQKTDCTLHGFRSSFGTWARGETYPVTLPSGEVRKVRLYDEALIEECLAHVVGGAVRNAYVRDDFLELRRAPMQAWAAYCGKVIEGDVVQMRRRPAPVAVAA